MLVQWLRSGSRRPAEKWLGSVLILQPWLSLCEPRWQGHPFRRLLVSRIVTGNDRARALRLGTLSL